MEQIIIKKNNKKQEEDSDDEFFRETTDMLDSGKKLSLGKGFLEYRKLKDINEETHNALLLHCYCTAAAAALLVHSMGRPNDCAFSRKVLGSR